MSKVPIVVTPNALERQLDEAREPSCQSGAFPLYILPKQRKPSDGQDKNPHIYAIEESSIYSTSTTISTSMHSALVEVRDNVDNKVRRKEKDGQKIFEGSFSEGRKHASSHRPTLHELVTKLVRQERQYGRYSHAVSCSYQIIGEEFVRMNSISRSVVMLRASYRIDMFLYGASTNGIFPEPFRQALMNRGIPENSFPILQENIATSVNFEMNGDMLRQFGMAQRAALEYQKAIKIEESAFGRENPCLATLWRKLACLIAVTRADGNRWEHELDEMDRLDGRWLIRHTVALDIDQKQMRTRATAFIPAKVGQALRKGDESFQNMEFSVAVSRYRHAVAINKTRRSRSKSSSRKNRTTRSRSRSRSRDKSLFDSKSPHSVMRETTTMKVEGADKMEKPMQEIEKLLSETKLGKTSKQGKSPMKSKASKPEAKKQMEVPSSHQTVVSRSKRVKRTNSNSSTQSMYQTIKQYMDPQRPKSDSHVTKLAKKVASKTSKQMRKAIISRSFHKASADSSKDTKDDNDASFAESIRPMSDTYAYLASPPMTPLVDNTTTKWNDLLKETTASPHQGVGFAEFYDDDDDHLVLPTNRRS